MKKYKVFRSFRKIDKDVKQHELVAVEYGEDIDAVADRLIKAVTADAGALEKYDNGHWEAAAYAPEPVQNFRKVKRYQYYLTAMLYPAFGEKNDQIEYGVIEEAGEET